MAARLVKFIATMSYSCPKHLCNPRTQWAKLECSQSTTSWQVLCQSNSKSRLVASVRRLTGLSQPQGQPLAHIQEGGSFQVSPWLIKPSAACLIPASYTELQNRTFFHTIGGVSFLIFFSYFKGLVCHYKNTFSQLNIDRKFHKNGVPLVTFQ